MKKYEGYLLCTDMDGTLLNSNHTISDENTSAIRRFIDEGGIFSVATGRTPVAITPIFTYFVPNAPIVTHNGAAVYDMETDRYLYTRPLDADAVEVLKHVEEKFDFVGFEVYDNSNIYFHKINESVQWHIDDENLSPIIMDYRNIPLPWTKAMFVQSREETVMLREHILSSAFRDKYSFIKSSSTFLEILDLGATKGNALLEMKQMLGKKIHTVICVGDNENDISLLKAGDISYAVENAIDDLKKVADRITVGNNDNAIAKIIDEIKV